MNNKVVTMKIIILVSAIIIPSITFSQVDTTIASRYSHLADSPREAYQYDSSDYYYEKAGEI